MPVTCTAENRSLTARISGEVDHHAAKDIMAELDRQIGQGLPNRLTLDLSGVTFMDSSGIAVLLRAWRRVNETGGQVRLCAVPAQPGKLLRAAGIDRLIPFE